eukprot:TRINITY_DN55786_c0_g1_i1.p1 TRINITY_DN55786_c0_g1~~TRINITY_DN55786_c0_g1_i1.p1  ORF type:complete len:152 (+),score=35.55 TRINITY_DN55786_c0_g1_i1:61-516(+)
MTDERYAAVAAFSNRYPDMSLQFTVANGSDVSPEDDDEEARAFVCPSDVQEIVLQVQIQREGEAGPVHAPRYPGTKEEFWWLVVGGGDDNVLAIKRLSFETSSKATLRVDSFSPGENTFKLYFMCDSFLGCDQEYAFDVKVGDGDANGMES